MAPGIQAFPPPLTVCNHLTVSDARLSRGWWHGTRSGLSSSGAWRPPGIGFIRTFPCLLLSFSVNEGETWLKGTHLGDTQATSPNEAQRGPL